MEDWFVDRRTNDDGVLVVCGVGRGRRWKWVQVSCGKLV